jgi:hypothetical protein
MAIKTVSGDYSAISVIGSLTNPCANTVGFFDLTYLETDFSPLDAYIQNCAQLNKLWVAEPSISPEFSRLLLLGYVSAIESYFRSIFRIIINNDKKARAASHSYVVPFGAALFYDKSMLAEALLEGYSFSGEKDVKKAYTNFLGVGNLDDSIKNLLVEFEKICQMRHCCVHRFGKLGSHNGIALGLDNHKEVLEKPVVFDKSTLGNVASWLMSFVKAINNDLFKLILDRSVDPKNPHAITWQWTFYRDKKKFTPLYNAFATTLDTVPSPTVEEIYNRFKLTRAANKKKTSK